MKKLPLVSASLLALLMGFTTLTLTGCDNDGPMEEAGEEIDEGIDEIGDEIDDAT